MFLSKIVPFIHLKETDKPRHRVRSLRGAEDGFRTSTGAAVIYSVTIPQALGRHH